MLSLRIAGRYLLAPKSHNAVNVIAIIAVMGVAVATAAMTVVLSVYNGFADLAAAHLSAIDAPVEVSRADGRVIEAGDSLAQSLAEVPGVETALPVLAGRGLATTPTTQAAVIFKGVPDSYNGSIVSFDKVMIDGTYAPATDGGADAAQISVGVSNSLLAKPGVTPGLSLYVPRRNGRINPANPAAAFSGADLFLSGVFRVNQSDIDADRMIVPLSVARRLLEYDSGATAVEIAPKPGTSVKTLTKTLRAKLGPAYLVRDRLQQRSEAFRMIKVEKWVTFMMLVFVLLIALFNIVSTLSLLIIEKRDNMRTLRAMGAPRRLVRAVFILEGWLITLTGGVIGLVLGVALCLAQQWGGFIKLNGDPQLLSVDAYPVRVAVPDLLAVFAAVALTGLITAAIARLLTGNNTKNRL